MNIVKFRSIILYPLVTSLLGSASGALASDPTSLQPTIPLNMETSSFSVPVAISGSSFQLFDVGQESTIPITIDALWTPSSSTSYGLLQFRSNAKGTAGYLLTITANSVAISTLHADGKQTPLGAAAYTFQSTPYHFQLIENGFTFTVVDATTQQTILNVTDKMSTFAQNPAIYIGSNSKGTWSFSAAEQGLFPANPPIGQNDFVTPDLDQDNTSGANVMLVNHFGLPHANFTATIDFSSMTDTGTTVLPLTAALGHFDIRRQNGAGGTANNYSVYIFADHLAIGKTVAGSVTIQQKSKPFQTTLTKNALLPLQIVANNATITAKNTVTGESVTWTDTSNTPYLSGYQFGAYTDPNAFDCWDDIKVKLQ